MAQRFRVEFVVFTLLLGMAATSLAADHSAILSGVVRDSRGVPQMGALVQVSSPDAAARITTFTDLQGRYLVQRLVPGLYGIRATAALFVPASREHLRLQADRRVVVNLTLSGLFDEPSWLPAKARGAEEPKDDWNWTLRSSANRPILKLGDDDDAAMTPVRERQARSAGHASRASMTSPSKDFGDGGVRLNVRAERVRANRSKVTLNTFAERNRSVPSTASSMGVSSSLERQMGPAGVVGARIAYVSHPEVTGGGAPGPGGLRVMTVSSAQKFEVGDIAELEAGNRIQVVRGLTSAVVTRPFLKVSAHPSPSWTVTYGMATATDNQDYDSAILRDSELPTVASMDGRSETEDGLHQEISLSHRTHATMLALAFYADAMERISLSGEGERLTADDSLFGGAAPQDAELLVDQNNGSFRALSSGYRNSGVNLLITRAIGSGTWVALQYCTGTAMAEVHGAGLPGGVPMLQARRSQSATASLKANIARTGTRIRTTYRWQPGVLVTSIDPYDVLSGGDFLSLHLRQPLTMPGILPEGMELTVDGANMLDQGRQRFVGRNGRPMYLASTPASLRAGIVFSF